LKLARDVKPSGSVAQVSAQLTEDGGHRKRAEHQSALGIEPIKRFDQA
jgi:hypothetical protein